MPHVWQRASLKGKFNLTVTLQSDVEMPSDTTKHHITAKA
jgi:hypothetical protein